MKMRRWGTVLGFIGIAGCAGNDVFDVAATPLAGRVGGQTWTLGTMQTNPFLSASSETFFVEAYPEVFTPCSGGGSDATGNRVILNVPKAAGAYALSFAFTQTFFIQTGNVNLAATRGRMTVDEVSDTTIRGGAHFEVDGDNTVNGQFQASICP